MNHGFQRRMLALIMLALAALVTGCASGPDIVGTYVSRDGSTLVTGTVRKIGGGREMIINDSCTLEVRVNDPVLKLKIEKGEVPPPACANTGSRIDLAHGTEIGRDLATSVAPVAVGAVIQGQLAKDSARKSNCKGLGCTGSNQNQTVHVNLPCTANCGVPAPAGK